MFLRKSAHRAPIAGSRGPRVLHGTRVVQVGGPEVRRSSGESGVGGVPGVGDIAFLITEITG
jgi:hypothetical protein